MRSLFLLGLLGSVAGISACAAGAVEDETAADSEELALSQDTLKLEAVVWPSYPDRGLRVLSPLTHELPLVAFNRPGYGFPVSGFNCRDYVATGLAATPAGQAFNSFYSTSAGLQGSGEATSSFTIGDGNPTRERYQQAAVELVTCQFEMALANAELYMVGGFWDSVRQRARANPLTPTDQPVRMDIAPKAVGQRTGDVCGTIVFGPGDAHLEDEYDALQEEFCVDGSRWFGAAIMSRAANFRDVAEWLKRSKEIFPFYSRVYGAVNLDNGDPPRPAILGTNINGDAAIYTITDLTMGGLAQGVREIDGGGNWAIFFSYDPRCAGCSSTTTDRGSQDIMDQGAMVGMPPM